MMQITTLITCENLKNLHSLAYGCSSLNFSTIFFDAYFNIGIDQPKLWHIGSFMNVVYEINPYNMM